MPDSEQERMRAERRRERQIRRENAAEAVRARVPFWRSRIDRSTGRQHKDPVNRGLYKNRVQRYRDMNERNRQLRDQLERDARAAANRRHVRETLAARQPRVSRTVERVVRDLSPRTQGRSR